MTWKSLLLAAPALLLTNSLAAQSSEQPAPAPEEAANETPIIVEGSRDREPPRAQTGSRIAYDPLFTEEPVATSTGLGGLTPGVGFEPFHGSNAISKRITSTCVSDNDDVGERASCLLLQAREAVAENDFAAASDMYRYLVSSDEFSATERLTGGTELYNLAGTTGDPALREEALIRLVASGTLPAERQPGARRSLVSMALARGEKALAVERLEEHVALSPEDAQSFANLAILRRELGHAGAEEAMRRAIAIHEASELDVPQGWSDFVHLPQIGFLSAPWAACSDDELFVITQSVPLNPQDPEMEEIGELIYAGGLEIDPGEEEIGGISGLEWHDGLLYAVSDDGHWLTIETDEIDGRLVYILAVTRGELNDERGRRLRGDDADAEAITRAGKPGSWMISFERNHRFLRYETFDAKPTNELAGIVELMAYGEANQGVEALTFTGTELLVCSEAIDPSRPNCLRGGIGAIDLFSLAPPPELVEHGGAPTDATCQHDGTCYVLFRSYREGEGNRAAILALPPEGEPKVLATFLPPLTLDNFEGIAVREEFGKTYLYIVSDNNFSDSQRNLLMKFEIRSDEQMIAPDPEPEVNYETQDVVLQTALGDITVRLETERAPITAANFLRYVDEDRLDGTVFYRAMKLNREPQPNGLIQGGVRFDPARVLPPIAHEPTTKTGLTHTNGALSMAMGDPGTANGDFSIMLQDQLGLDANPDASEPIWQNGYAVFGYVIEGMDVVSAIHALPADPDAGQGVMRGQMLADPVEIIEARRVEAEASSEE